MADKWRIFLKFVRYIKKNFFYMPKKEMVTNYNVRVKLCGDNARKIKNLQVRRSGIKSKEYVRCCTEVDFST